MTSEPFALSPEHAQIQAEARTIAAELGPRARQIRQHLLDHGQMDPQLWELFCERGWPGAVLPDEYGGMGGGLLALALVLVIIAVLPSIRKSRDEVFVGAD